mmetsp:Transcript_3249/g.10000  ORF Transcript_3249/g.10000 Transcript_3249/m.10000 type:complete len:1280 (-) Transcript_3249:19-3858(-)
MSQLTLSRFFQRGSPAPSSPVKRELARPKRTAPQVKRAVCKRRKFDSVTSAPCVGSQDKVICKDPLTASAPRCSSFTTTDSITGSVDVIPLSLDFDASDGDLPLDIEAVVAVVGLRNLSELERQVVRLKADAGPSLLIVEVGYKWLAFCEDAATIGSALHMCRFRRGHFLVTSFPFTRLEVHLLRLLHLGFEVTIARQRETALEKAAGGAPNSGFVRTVDGTYTLSTYVPTKDEGGAGSTLFASSAPHWLVSIHETPPVRSRGHGGVGVPTLHVLAVDVATATVLFEEQPGHQLPPAGLARCAPKSGRGSEKAHDAARDGRSLNEGAANGLATSIDMPRLLLAHVLESMAPVEIVVPRRPPLSPRVAEELKAYAPNKRPMPCHDAAAGQRVHLPRIQPEQSGSAMGSLVDDVRPAVRVDEEEESQFTIEAAASLIASIEPAALSSLIHAPSGLARALGSIGSRLVRAKQGALLSRSPLIYEPLRSHGCMRLGSGVLDDLHVLSPEGHSMLSTILNASPNPTAAGSRLLRRWLAAPLCEPQAINTRLDAVEELRNVAAELFAVKGYGRDADASAGAAAIAVCRELRGHQPAFDLEATLARIARCAARPCECVVMCKTVESMLKSMVILSPPTSVMLRSILTPDEALRSALEDWCHHLAPAAVSSSSSLVEALLGEYRADDMEAQPRVPALGDDTLAPVCVVSNARVHLPDPVPSISRDGTSAQTLDALCIAHARVLELERMLEEEQLHRARKVLNVPNLCFRHQSSAFAGRDEYYFELLHGSTAARRVPADWIRVGQTKAVVRYRPPAVEACLCELALARQRRDEAAKAAWAERQRFLWPHLRSLRRLTTRLAHLDALLCLASLARTTGYSRPQVIADEKAFPTLHVRAGRHPLVEELRKSSGKAFVPNDTFLGGRWVESSALAGASGEAGRVSCRMPLENGRATIQSAHDAVTSSRDREASARFPHVAVLMGPNMGGKSCYCRQVGILVILAQIGSFVPAEECILTPMRSLATRMGARDSPSRGISTFELELAQTSEAFALAAGLLTDCPLSSSSAEAPAALTVGQGLPITRSLVLLDEVGRGTASHDGAAIAYAILNHIADCGALCIFTTHYPEVGELAALRPRDVDVLHMGAIASNRATNSNLLCTTTTTNATPLNADNKTFLTNEAESSVVATAHVPDVEMLYKLEVGAADASYGLHVGRLAGLPDSVLSMAAAESARMRSRLRLQSTARRDDELVVCLARVLAANSEASDCEETQTTAVLLQLQHILRNEIIGAL